MGKIYVISPQSFFDKIKTYVLTKEEFYEVMKKRAPMWTDELILSLTGTAVDVKDGFVVLIRKEHAPEKYLRYIDIHERWELYMTFKNGYNLWVRSARDFYRKNENYDNSIKIDLFEDVQEALGEYYEVWGNQLLIYNYEFRHEFAIWKEYLAADEDGILDEVHQWSLEYHNKSVRKDNDRDIRESIYKKITIKKKHYFLRAPH